MPQIELFDIENPCVGICQAAKNGYCIGCLRSRAERQHWYQMTDEQKHNVLILLAKRRKKVNELAAKANRPIDDTVMMYTPDMFEA